MRVVSAYLIRLGGPAAMLGGLMWSLKALLDRDDAPPWPNDWSDALFFLAPLLMAVGFAGLYALYAGRLMGVGQGGITQGFVGLGLLVAGFFGSFTLGFEWALRISAFGFFVLAFGMTLLGFSAVRNGTFGRWNFLPLVIAVLAPAGILFGNLLWLRVAISALFGLGWVLLGTLILAESRKRGPG